MCIYIIPGFDYKLCMEFGGYDFRVCMEYGGCDISRSFHWLMTRAGLPYKNCDVTDRMDALLLQELKETYCHLDQVRRLTTRLSMCGDEMRYESGAVEPCMDVYCPCTFHCEDINVSISYINSIFSQI